MKSLVNTKSMFGNVPDIFARKIRKWKCLENRKDSTFLIIDDKDGHLGLYPLSLDFNVTVYEPNKKFIQGGLIEIPVSLPNSNEYVYIKRNCMGILDRARLQFKEDNLVVYNRNFYEIDNFNKYDYVCACKSFDREENSNYSIEVKIDKLKKAVKEDGYLYLEYFIALDDKNTEKYPINQFLRKDEIIKYFDKKEWTIMANEVKIIDNYLTPINRNNEKVLIGYLDVRKRPLNVPKTRKTTSYKRIDFNTDKEVKCTRKYIINGVVR